MSKTALLRLFLVFCSFPSISGGGRLWRSGRLSVERLEEDNIKKIMEADWFLWVFNKERKRDKAERDMTRLLQIGREKQRKIIYENYQSLDRGTQYPSQEVDCSGWLKDRVASDSYWHKISSCT
ncbi:hypothetical protein NC652_031391 [Populus alba x Populus x berolinensis]|nr:hypothetical protein NC652_031391 [Populus alba x Populus x berolinensis]